MICTTIHNKSFEEIIEILENPVIEMAEIRLDSCPLDLDQVDSLFSITDTPLVATCRGTVDQEEKLSVAARAGARYVDLEIEAPADISKSIRNVCSENGVELIRSYHNWEQTPDAEFLQQLIARCRRYGADIVKIAVTSMEAGDIDRLTSLYEKETQRGRLIAFAMGADGRRSRIDALKYGAPFSYAAVSEDDAVAPGQYSASQMHAIVFGEAGNINLSGMQLPSSKSLSQRAIIAAALANGVSHLSGYTECEDSASAIGVAQALGAEVSLAGDVLTIKGIGPITEDLALERLDVGESGLLARLMIPLMAQINGHDVTIEGRRTLTHRPLKGVSDIMASFGVLVRENKVPLTVEGKLIPGVAEVSGRYGSQLISGLLMALPLADKNSSLYVTEPKSIPYMFMTLDMLRHFKIRTGSEMEGDEEMIENQDWSACTGISFKIRGSQQYQAADIEIEKDWSAAAVLMVAGALFGSVEIIGLDSKSLQADLSIIDILVEAGAAVSSSEEGAIRVRKGPLQAVDVDLSNSPDLFPPVAVLASFCQGTSRIGGVGRLAGKESDRAAAIVEMLSGMGVNASIQADDLVVEGESLAWRHLNGAMLRGGHFSSHHDHRMAMALKIASLGAESPVMIDDEACVGKSFPEFFSLFD